MASRYEPEAFEAKWRQRWKDADLFRTREDDGRPKYYTLDFFPYPSGAGLSVGHLRNFIPTDVLARVKRMQGFNVLHPMGWDAFGLPAENEAMAKERHPGPMVEEYAETYKRQEDLVGISYDWSRELNSSRPDFYKWTQWIFLVLLRRGLAYHGEFPANWCPNCQTVLANEEVEGGLCWRCGTPVEKKILKQWFFKITDYAQRLIDDLSEIEWPEGIKTMQRNWIGRSEGVEFEWQVERRETSSETNETKPGVNVTAAQHESVEGVSFRAFTTRIDTVFGATYCVMSPEHPLALDITSEFRQQEVQQYILEAERKSEQDRLSATRDKTGVFTGAYARNPFTNDLVPIWIADYVLMGYGTGAIMAVPGHDERDFEFAQKFGLHIERVIVSQAGAEDELPFVANHGVMVGPGEFSGVNCVEAQKRLGEIVEERGIGERKVNYRLRDWLISRQRLWGCPIPVVHCDRCGTIPVPESELPVLLPDIDSYKPSTTGQSPLADLHDWVEVKCPACGETCKRETDTMGGFACSSWYFLRFCDPHNDDEAFSPERVDYWMPVDCYVGGAEHAVMHLLYARFWTKVLFDEGIVSFKEPFSMLRNQGMLLAPTPFRRPKPDETLRTGEDGIQITYETAEELPKDDVFWKWEKMSKSKGNVVTPDEAVERYGADALRVYELFEAPFEQTIQWSEERVQGSIRFLHRVFKLTAELKPRFSRTWRDEIDGADASPADADLRHLTHITIQKITNDVNEFAFNTAVAQLMEFSNGISDAAKNEGLSDAALSEALETLITVLAPFAPHTADEIWDSYGFEGFTYHVVWPEAVDRWLATDTVTIVVQVNGKVRDNLTVASGTDKGELEKLAMASDRVIKFIDGKTVRKVIVIPDKLVNVVAN